MEALEEKKIKKVKKKVNKLRIEESALLGSVDKMGEKTIAIIPEDIETMFAGKMCDMLIGQKVAATNMMWGYVRDNCRIDEETYKKIRESKHPLKDLGDILGVDHPMISTAQKLMGMVKDFDAGFKNFKDMASDVADGHSLCKRFAGVRGLSSYQMAMLMSRVKDIERFRNPGAFCMWAGIASVTDHETGQVFAVTKGNIKHIQAIYAKQGKEFKGFDTVIAGRMTVIFDCFSRSRGFFYNYYLQIR